MYFRVLGRGRGGGIGVRLGREKEGGAREERGNHAKWFMEAVEDAA